MVNFGTLTTYFQFSKISIMKRIITILLLVFSLETTAQEGVVVKSIFFGGGSWYIDSEQADELAKFIADFPNIDQYNITVISHTDNIGGELYNQWLSEKRSKAVVQQLILNDIKLENIYIENHGQRNPVYDNTTFEGRIRNRRVDIIFEPLTM